MASGFDQLRNEELDAWAARFVGLHLGIEEDIGFWLDDQNRRVFYADDSHHYHGDNGYDYWEPTAEGNEHQAMMMVRVMGKDGWDFHCDMPSDLALPPSVDFTCPLGPCSLHGNPTEDWHGVVGIQADTLGRAIVLAALKAKGVGDANTTTD